MPKSIIFLIGIGALVFLVLLLYLFGGIKAPGQPEPSATPKAGITNKVTDFTPVNGATEISGATTIIVTFEKTIPKENLVKFRFQPELTYGEYSITSKFPTKQVLVKPSALLDWDTKYTVTVLYNDEPIYTSSFTTTKEPQAQSDPESIRRGTDAVLGDYPLLMVLPYDTSTVSVKYNGKRSLQVTIKSGAMEAAKTEVENWMRQNNVDPSTHKILYINQ